ncbi:hypothetical protein ACHWQZ_G014729 [Mnemiopsis leidyi]
MFEDIEFQEYENVMKKIEDATKTMMQLRKENKKLGRQELKDKVGDKLNMATTITSLTNACISESYLLRRLSSQNFDIPSRAVDLSSSALKLLTDEMRCNQIEMKEEITSVKIKISKETATKSAISFADCW